MKCLVLFTAILMFASARAGELKTVESPRGATIRIWAQQTSKTADTLVLLIPGGNGAGHMKVADGKVELSQNFIARTAGLYAEAGLISVLMDAPSDSIKGMSDKFRISDDHYRDVSAILDGFAVKRVFLVANSRGTLSAMALASRMADDARLKGVVLTSTIQYKDYIETARPELVKAPVLIVHHKDDACDLNAFAGARDVYDHLLATNKKVLMVPITAGFTPQGEDPCMPISVHGFYGADAEVTDRIIRWITTR
jgi:pimeloyl-ACP methyl ester carboxylesterase